MVKISVGTIFTKFHGFSPYERKVVDKCTKYYIEGSEFSYLYRTKAWDGFVHLLNFHDIMPTGMLDKVLRKFKKLNIKYRIKDSRKHFDVADTAITSCVLQHSRKPRPYQIEAVSAIFKKRAGITNIPPGTGKTFIMAMVMSIANNQPFVVLASGTSLLLQLMMELAYLIGEDVGYIGESKWEIKRITVSSIDTLSEMLLPPKKKIKFKNPEEKSKYMARVSRWMETKPKVVEFLSSMAGVCLDEAHHSPAKTFKAVLQACSNATLRAGFTATYMRSGSDDMLLEAMTGGVIYKKTTSWMIKEGYLARPVIVLMPFDPPELVDAEYDNYKDVYQSGIVKNIYRNALLAGVMKILYKYKLRTIVFVREKAHGEVLCEMLKRSYSINGSRVIFATGGEVGSVRCRILKAFRSGRVRILLCTRIFDEGVDFPEANAGIKAGALKYEGTQIQQVGRLLRKVPCKNGEIDREREEKVLFVDIMDMHDSYLVDWALTRFKTYSKEEEFIVEITNNLIEFENIVKKYRRNIIVA